MQPQLTEASPPTTKSSPEWPWLAGLFGLALVIRLIYALQLTFPPLDDPAYYVQGARSFFNGHPLDLSIIWNFHPTPASVTHPGFDFWMPLTAFAIALSFLFFGDNTLAAQLPSVLTGALLPVLTFWLARRVFASIGLEPRPCRLLTWGAALYVTINPLLAYQSAVPDSQMLFAVCIVGAILLWTGPEGVWQSLGMGLLMGLAYLARSHGSLLVLAWGLATLYRLYKDADGRKNTFKLAVLTVVGIAVPVVPWLVRNWLTFGSFSSPAVLDTALITRYQTLFNYEAPINFSTFFEEGVGKIIQVRLEALANGWVGVLGTMFAPTVLLPAVGLFFLWRRSRSIVGRWVLYCLVLGLVGPLVFSVASTNGSFYHNSGSMAPFGAIGFVFLLYVAGERYRRWKPEGVRLFPILLVILILVELFQFGVSAGSTVATHRNDQEKYARLTSWLASNNVSGPVISDEPSSLNYATGIPAIRLPSDEPIEVLQRLAQRYGATYIVVTSYFGLYPTALESTTNNKIFPLAYTDPQGQFEIYRTEK